MKSITINGSQRESVGKSSTKALRNAGRVPCVVYGGEKPVHFSADEISFSKLVYTPNAHTVVISLVKARLSRFYPFYPFFLWDIVFPSLFLSSARARATCTNFCADFPLYSFLNKRIQFSAMVKAP